MASSTDDSKHGSSIGHSVVLKQSVDAKVSKYLHCPATIWDAKSNLKSRTSIPYRLFSVALPDKMSALESDGYRFDGGLGRSERQNDMILNRSRSFVFLSVLTASGVHGQDCC